MSAPAREIPKFSSFRPKTTPSQQQSLLQSTAPSQQQSSLQSTALKRQRSPEHRQRSVKRKRTPDVREQQPRHDRSASKHDSQTSDERTHNQHRSRELSAINEPLPVHHNEESSLFVFDGKGDRQNVAYEKLHKYSIPSYQRIGYGSIMGLDLRFKIDRVESTIDKVIILDKSATSRLNTQRLLLKRQRDQTLPALLIQDEHELDLEQDFVGLSPSIGNYHQASSDDEFFSSKNLDISGRPSLYESQMQLPDVPSPADLQARQQNVQFVRATKSNPSDLQAWLDLATHQEHLVSPGASAQTLTNSERRTLADMRIAVYEKALKNFSSNEASKRERLILELLHEASIAWDAQKYLQKLKDILQQHPTSFSIWTLYLNACQANPVNFHFEDVKAFFLSSLRTLGSSKDGACGPEAQNMMLYLILRYTFFLLDTGYDELSIAIWQALCEYHMFRPKNLALMESGQALAEFEQFWDSERPRFGEVGARGWYAWIDDEKPLLGSSRCHFDEALSPDLPFKSFSDVEKATSWHLRFPGRTMDQVGTEDPFHVVLFSDVHEILEATTGGFERASFCNAIFCYLGLPTVDSNASPQPRWRSDIFLSNGLLRLSPTNTGDNTSDKQHVQHYQTSTDLLFSRAFEDLSVMRKSSKLPGYQQSVEAIARFAQRVLLSLVQLSPEDDGLAEYYLAFELSAFPQEASKAAKSILRKRPSSLRLYNACATIEAGTGKIEKAVQIWFSAISMKDSFPIPAQSNLVLLLSGWIWCSLEANQATTALSNLASFGGNTDSSSDGTSMSTATLLRLRKTFHDGFEHSISQLQPHIACLNAEMLALMAYLIETDRLHASVETINKHCDAVLHRSTHEHVLLELLYQAKAKIIDYHIRQKRPYRPAFVRAELEASIALFPNNTIFLEMYRANEARFRLDDRVRSLLKTQVLTNAQSPLVGWTFAIRQELLRYSNQSSGSTAESVRATFKRALMATGSPVRYSKLLWAEWFHFEKKIALGEVSEKHISRRKSTAREQPLQRLKQVFLSGLHHLPWSKEWILLGLETFDRDDEWGWEVGDLRRLYNVLVDRELRVRTEGLDDLLENKM